MDKVKVLMIDDNVQLIEAVKEYFKSSKSIEIVDEAHDGLDGYEKLEKSICDVVVLDLIMPKKDGLYVLEQMKKNNINKKVIVATSYNTQEVIREVSDYGVNYYILKPFDFTDLESIYRLFLQLEELEEEEEDLFSTTSSFIQTLKFYIDQADLNDIQKEILELKIRKKKNQEIAAYINGKYGKTYTINYISTIFRQKVLPAINNAAIYHKHIISSLPFEEEFKVCTKCGRILLRDPINFVRKSRAKDGLSNHCKACDKRDREEKKKKEGEKK